MQFLACTALTLKTAGTQKTTQITDPCCFRLPPVPTPTFIHLSGGGGQWETPEGSLRGPRVEVQQPLQALDLHPQPEVLPVQ